MKLARTSVATGLAWGIVVACACGGSNVVFSQDGGSSSSSSGGSGSGGGSSGGSSGGSASSSGSSSGSGGGSSSGSSSGGETCGVCTTNADCQSCAAPPNGSSNCCQAGVGTCYVVPQSTCPGGSGSGSGSGGSSGGSSGSSSGGTTCGACTTNLECQLTCPAVQGGGTNCCETSAGICYATSSSTCPVIPDASTE